MTTSRIGRPSRSEKPRARISTTELLAAVAALGPHWPTRFSDREIVDVTEAVDRELLAGNLQDGITLTVQGERALGTRQDGPAEDAPLEGASGSV